MAAPITKATATLAAELQAEARIPVILVEGPSDRYLVQEGLAAARVRASVYEIELIEVTTQREYNLYGRNKARVLSVLKDENLQDYLGKNLFLLVDADLDPALGRVVEADGLIYSSGACLPAEYLPIDRIREFANRVSARAIGDETIDNISYFCRVMFHVKVWGEFSNKKFSSISAKAVVRPSSVGGIDSEKIRQLLRQRLGSLEDSESCFSYAQANVEENHPIQDALNIHVMSDAFSWQMYKDRHLDRAFDEEYVAMCLRIFLTGLKLHRGPSIARLAREARRLLVG